jgi:predicted regulator of Ras-like GTPase activity (Roadblock/LC7/MglB family)
MPDPTSRSGLLDRAIADLLAQAPEVEAAAVVSFDGLPMASALPATMDEDRVAAMSAALLSLGERAAEGLGRGGLNQVYIEGDSGTVFLVSCDDEAVLVAVAAKGAKVGMMLYEVRRAAEAVANALRQSDVAEAAPVAPSQPASAPVEPAYAPSYDAPSYDAPSYDAPSYDAGAAYTEPVTYAEPAATYAPAGSAEPAWPSYLPNGSGGEPTTWS